ncbi:MAG: hypothetical protein FWD12_07355 [Alphaproteobacteria bacterium]|nr:hypothetical protein [Alphaproteobacteria bacterium]
MGDDDVRREQIRSLLAGGLKTQVFPRAYTQDEIQAVVAKARGATLKGKLEIGGFTLTPVADGDIDQACETCMYYQVHRRYCELPELDLPVEPGWSCRLWRI